MFDTIGSLNREIDELVTLARRSGRQDLTEQLVKTLDTFAKERATKTTPSERQALSSTNAVYNQLMAQVANAGEEDSPNYGCRPRHLSKNAVAPRPTKYLFG